MVCSSLDIGSWNLFFGICFLDFVFWNLFFGFCFLEFVLFEF